MTQLKWGRPRADKNRWEAHLGELKVIALIHPSDVALSDAQAAREPVSYDMITYLNGGDRRTLPVAPLRSAKLRAEVHVEELLKAAGLVLESEPEQSLTDKLVAEARRYLIGLGRTGEAERKTLDEDARRMAAMLTETTHRHLADELIVRRSEDPETLVLEELLTAMEELGIP